MRCEITYSRWQPIFLWGTEDSVTAKCLAFCFSQKHFTYIISNRPILTVFSTVLVNFSIPVPSNIALSFIFS